MINIFGPTVIHLAVKEASPVNVVGLAFIKGDGLSSITLCYGLSFSLVVVVISIFASKHQT